MIILDTDIISLVQREESTEGLRVRAKIAQLPKGEVAATTVITYEEQIQGWFAAMSAARKSAQRVEKELVVYARLLQHIMNYNKIRVLPYDRKAADRFAELVAMKLRIGTNDLKIASIVFATDATLVTRNLGDFSKVPNLSVEDWSRS
jgi:tRNA(fMet)-specific endonuclease VapC